LGGQCNTAYLETCKRNLHVLVCYYGDVVEEEFNLVAGIDEFAHPEFLKIEQTPHSKKTTDKRQC